MKKPKSGNFISAIFKLFGLLIWFLVRVVLCVIFYGTPLIGLWVASSLAAYLGGPSWMPWIAGALLFPVIPVLWELHAWTHRDRKKKAWFTPLDRVSMRTFVVGLAFLTLLLYRYPQTAFVSLSTRGDWMLAGVKDSHVPIARHLLFASAGGLEWLYHATRNNPYKSRIDDKARQRSNVAALQAEQELAKQREQHAMQKQEQDIQKIEQDVVQEQQKEAPQAKETAQEQQTNEEQQKESSEKLETAQEQPQKTTHVQQQETAQKQNNANVVVKWPWKQAKLHPTVATMPHSVETSIQSVAQYIAKMETDPVQRIKALHDYVADRIAYDGDAFYSGHYPDQDAETVFKVHKGVCAGYANLLSALATAINEQIVVVIGDARDDFTGDNLTGSGHAWNAARIDGHWYLIDSCWDSGSLSREKGFTKRYSADYFLTPPEVMIQDHFPEEPTWQLLAQPLSQGDFLRQPMLSPSFQSAGFTLVAPLRAENEEGAKAFATVKNPNNNWLMAQLEQDGKGIGRVTNPTNKKIAQLAYSLPDKGRYRLNMYSNDKNQYGNYKFVGSLDFVNR